MARILSEAQCRAAMAAGEFGAEVVAASPSVAVVLTQSWCPQWTRMRSYLERLPAERAGAVFYIEYDRAPFFEEFMRFKEDSFGNREIPYLRFYRDGRLVRESNYLDEASFLRILG